jgi:hypothetical protein
VKPSRRVAFNRLRAVIPESRSDEMPLRQYDDYQTVCATRALTVSRLRETRARNCSLPLCGQRGDYVFDNPPAQEHPVVADAADPYGLHSGVGGHRPDTRHDHVGRGRECQPPHAVG